MSIFQHFEANFNSIELKSNTKISLQSYFCLGSKTMLDELFTCFFQKLAHYFSKETRTPIINDRLWIQLEKSIHWTFWHCWVDSRST